MYLACIFETISIQNGIKLFQNDCIMGEVFWWVIIFWGYDVVTGSFYSKTVVVNESGYFQKHRQTQKSGFFSPRSE
eukprot:UN24826